MAATIGIRFDGRDTIYYVIVNGKARSRSYSGPDGLRKALAEAYEIEFEEAAKNIEELNLAAQVAAQMTNIGLTVTNLSSTSPTYSFLDAQDIQDPEEFSSIDEVAEYVQAHPSCWKG
ncbi:hypothetical protein [Rhodopseudomonas sp. B29]|uniref:hypothetical protein n=1 Tax=Rhodopseudomonas sp. B29 TaxID=95607 RepID=UPI0011D1BF37|nr:hypothetical protein [Rhodopseudomonas sp. B29]